MIRIGFKILSAIIVGKKSSTKKIKAATRAYIGPTVNNPIKYAVPTPAINPSSVFFWPLKQLILHFPIPLPINAAAASEKQAIRIPADSAYRCTKPSRYRIYEKMEYS